MTHHTMPLFHVSVEQRELARSARPIFQGATATADPGASWQQLGASGFLGAALPTAAGGLGLSCAEMALLTEEAGTLILPGPVVESLWVGIPAAFGGVGEEVLQPLLRGETYSVVVDRSLRGPDLDRAACVVVPTQEGDELFPASALGRLDAIPTSDPLERSFRLRAAPAGGGQRVAPLHGVGAVTLGRLGAAAYLNGVSRWLLDQTVAHTSERQQFGVPIASFQTVRHRLADLHVELEFARAACLSGACLVDEQSPEAAVAVDSLSIAARRAFALAHRHALQAHGGMGFTWEHPLHRRLKRGMTMSARFGTRRELESSLGRRLLAKVTSAPRETPPPPPI